MSHPSNLQVDGTEDIPYPGVGFAFETLEQQKQYLNRQEQAVDEDIQRHKDSIERANLKKRELQQSITEINVALAVLSTHA